MEKIKVFVDYCDIRFEVDGYYCKGSDYDNSGSSIEDAGIFIEDIDVYQILSHKQWNDIIDLALEEIED
jgi:hypothetical protein